MSKLAKPDKSALIRKQTQKLVLNDAIPRLSQLETQQKNNQTQDDENVQLDDKKIAYILSMFNDAYQLRSKLSQNKKRCNRLLDRVRAVDTVLSPFEEQGMKMVLLARVANCLFRLSNLPIPKSKVAFYIDELKFISKSVYDEIYKNTPLYGDSWTRMTRIQKENVFEKLNNQLKDCCINLEIPINIEKTFDPEQDLAVDRPALDKKAISALFFVFKFIFEVKNAKRTNPNQCARLIERAKMIETLITPHNEGEGTSIDVKIANCLTFCKALGDSSDIHQGILTLQSVLEDIYARIEMHASANSPIQVTSKLILTDESEFGNISKRLKECLLMLNMPDAIKLVFDQIDDDTDKAKDMEILVNQQQVLIALEAEEKAMLSSGKGPAAVQLAGKKEYELALVSEKIGDIVDAFKYLGTSANLGYLDGQYKLAEYYETGVVTLDPVLAFKWYLKAAEGGKITAQHKTAECFVNGIGTEKNMTQALVWYERAAEKGNPDSQYEMAKYYEVAESKESEKSKMYYKKAAYGYLKSADEGDINACLKLGDCYLYGNGVL